MLAAGWAVVRGRFAAVNVPRAIVTPRIPWTASGYTYRTTYVLDTGEEISGEELVRRRAAAEQVRVAAMFPAADQVHA